MGARERVVGEGLEVLLDGNQEGIMRHYFKGRGGGHWSQVGKSNAEGTTYGSREANIILRDGD